MYTKIHVDDLNIRQLKNLCKFYDYKKKNFASLISSSEMLILNKNGSLYRSNFHTEEYYKYKYNNKYVNKNDTIVDICKHAYSQYVINNDDELISIVTGEYACTEYKNVEQMCVYLILQKDGNIINLFGDPFSTVKDIISISSDGGHCILLRKDGKVYSYGSNEYGQLGLGHYNYIKVPTLIPNINNIIGITTGMDYTLLLRSDEKVYGFGRNYNGSLGINREDYESLRLSNEIFLNDKIHTPVLIPNISNIIHISAGGAVSLLLRNDGKSYRMGESYYEHLEDRTPKIIKYKNQDNFLYNALSFCNIKDNEINNIVNICAQPDNLLLLLSTGEIYIIASKLTDKNPIVANINDSKD
jgi:alpha-tubulin suppressor-like RCC1 family protein